MSSPSLEVPQFDRKVYPAIDASNYPAYVVTLATLGEHNQRPYKGAEKPPAKELLLQFEVIGQSIETEEGDELPKLLTDRVKFIGGDNAKLTKYLKAIDPTGEDTTNHTNVTGLTGKLCSIEVSKNESTKNPGTFVNYINGVSGKPNIPGWVAPEIRSTPAVFNFYEPDWETYQKLPKWVQRVMTEANDFEGSKLQALIAENETKTEAPAGNPEGNLPHQV